jgi:hypothetical protein
MFLAGCGDCLRTCRKEREEALADRDHWRGLYAGLREAVADWRARSNAFHAKMCANTNLSPAVVDDCWARGEIAEENVRELDKVLNRFPPPDQFDGKAENRQEPVRDSESAEHRSQQDVEPSETVEVKGYRFNKRYRLNLKKRDLDALNRLANEHGDELSLVVLNQLQMLTEEQRLVSSYDVDASELGKANARIRDLEQQLMSATREANRLPEYVRGNDELRKREAQQIAHIADLEQQLEDLEPRCMFYETVRVDVHQGRFIDIPNFQRFHDHACRFTVEALYPIGEPAEVSEMEGRDA